MQRCFDLIQFTNHLKKWEDLDSVKSTFSDMGFDEVGKKDNYLLILLDKKQNTFLKVIEQKKLKNLPKDLTNTVLLQNRLIGFESKLWAYEKISLTCTLN